jgi:hypothetical protein
MRATLSVLGLLTAALLAVGTDTASAQATRTWVSGVGDDANPCSRTAPCKTYAGAISKTAAAGEINCLDPGGFGALTITKSISIVCDYTEGGVLSASTTGFLINALATDIITLKGQDVEGFVTGINGIRVLSAGSVHIHKVQVRGVRGGGSGIIIDPSSATPHVLISESYITDNGTATTNGGITVKPTATGGARVVIENTKIENNSVGIRFDTSAATGGAGIIATVRNSVVAHNNGDGIVVNVPTVGAGVMINNTLSAGNQGFGVNFAAGAANTVRMGFSVVTGNIGGGVTANIASYKNNQINGNNGGEPALPTVGFD